MRKQYIKKINSINSWNDGYYDNSRENRRYAKKISRKKLKEDIDKNFEMWYNEYKERGEE